MDFIYSTLNILIFALAISFLSSDNLTTLCSTFISVSKIRSISTGCSCCKWSNTLLINCYSNFRIAWDVTF